MIPDENQDAFSLGIFLKGEEERGWRSIARKRKNSRERGYSHNCFPADRQFSINFPFLP
jgi:hypothetical protein